MTLPEAGKAVSNAIEGLKTNPSCLAAILLAALFAVLTYVAMQREAERYNARVETMMSLINRCMAEAGAGQ
jgi:hypothetical protein